jgi:hypothetical protein
MAMHDHAGAVANQDSVDCSFREQTSEGVVVACGHGELAALVLSAKKMRCAHGSPRKTKAGRESCGRKKRIVQHRLGTCQEIDQVPDLHAALEAALFGCRCICQRKAIISRVAQCPIGTVRSVLMVQTRPDMSWPVPVFAGWEGARGSCGWCILGPISE